MRDLLRVVRNKRHHWHDLPPNVKALVARAGAVGFPDCLALYFEERFPALLHHCFEVSPPSSYTTDQLLIRAILVTTSLECHFRRLLVLYS